MTMMWSVFKIVFNRLISKFLQNFRLQFVQTMTPGVKKGSHTNGVKIILKRNKIGEIFFETPTAYDSFMEAILFEG